MITFEQLETEVRRLAAENPDKVYESFEGNCYYNPTERDGKPYEACIFGQAFANLGETVGRVCEGRAIDFVLAKKGVVVDQYQRKDFWAREVQDGQDSGLPWSGAVARADRIFPLH